ncbi:MAG: 4-(cytidine 5'-diphospho)-2-C-methyl-D-erythritol kinase [Planctomycetes bacterium]|nr:4-(cytidine 5'-diphospho)-2-C-methyl-D-erythritol kinase [Planctomycetota bacterium]
MEQFRQTETGLYVLAPAKINLSLLVAGKRLDGYHELETIMAKVDYYDELLVEWGTKPGIELICNGPYWAPDGQDNLVWKACRLLLEKADKNPPIKVTLNKNIPAGTGLGSGSSDAAAALMALNRFANLGISNTDIHSIAAILGSDVNFFLEGPLAFCSGRGEKINPLNVVFPFQAILIIPDISTSTKKVYENYTHNPDIYGQLSAKINAFLDQNKVDFAAKMCANMLEQSCFQLYPELADIKKRVEESVRRSVCLSGSGSTLYCLIDGNDKIQIRDRCRDTVKRDTNCLCKLVSSNGW